MRSVAVEDVHDDARLRYVDVRPAAREALVQHVARVGITHRLGHGFC